MSTILKRIGILSPYTDELKLLLGERIQKNQYEMCMIEYKKYATENIRRIIVTDEGQLNFFSWSNSENG